MATLKQIRRRIRSIQSTQQITKAMEMVAASKLRRAQDRVLSSRPYAARIGAMLESLSTAARSLSHPLFETRPVNRRVMVVIASDKGLCGSFNMNIFRAIERQFEETGKDKVALVPLGRRACQYFGKREWTLESAVPEIGDQADPIMARKLALELIRLYTERGTDLVEIVYTQFVSTMSRRVRCEQILPVPEPKRKEGPMPDYIFEPSPEGIFSSLLPRYVENRILSAMAESLASEHSARMVSMGAATKNAKEVIDHLTLVRNRLRQAAITREINEIVGGADAIK